MLHNYLIDIVIMMMNIIAPYRETLYAILNTLHKLWNDFVIFNRECAQKIYAKNEKGHKHERQITQSRLKFALFTVPV